MGDPSLNLNSKSGGEGEEVGGDSMVVASLNLNSNEAPLVDKVAG